MAAGDPPLTDAGGYGEEIASLVAQYGDVPPPWALFPRVHPLDIHWRMGTGEGYRYLFDAWERAQSWTSEQRAAYVARWAPPFSWLGWAAAFIWPEDFADPIAEPDDEHFARLEALGLGSRHDWLRCYSVDPAKYPLADDTSARWIT